MIKAESGDYVVIRFRDGTPLPQGLMELGITSGAMVSGVGMLRDLVLGYWDGKDYVRAEIEEPVELLSLQGNLGEKEDGEPVVHAHVAVALPGGKAMGGHLISATVNNTLELVVLRLPGIRMTRRREETGLLGLYPSQAQGG